MSCQYIIHSMCWRETASSLLNVRVWLYLASSVTPVMCVFGSLIESQALSSSSLFITSSSWARANRILSASAATLEQTKKDITKLLAHTHIWPLYN